MKPFGVVEALKAKYSEELILPKGLYIKINPWWKFWLWFNPKSKRIPFKKHLTGTAVL